MADGASFSDVDNPKPVLQVGQDGDEGSVEISDLMLETRGSAPGAIMIEWNVAGSSPGAAGMWDVHTRIGGSAGTKLQSDTCSKNPDSTNPVKSECVGAFMLMHITKSASVLLENNHFWVADHELDLSDHNQIDIFSGRGMLVESTKPVWLYATAAEHSQLYNYQLNGAQNLYATMMQTETPYYQSNPDATVPFKANAKYNDPTFSDCTTASCKKSWGLRAVDSSDIFIYGGGLYS
jgi:glucan 1,3-beta-glucosidase